MTQTSSTNTQKPDPDTIKRLADKCIADAAARGVALEDEKKVVCDIQEAIKDELNFIAASEAKRRWKPALREFLGNVHKHLRETRAAMIDPR